MSKVLVYGTLKRGRRNHMLLERSKFLGVKWTDNMFKMYDAGGFPYVLWGTNAILAELFEVDQPTLKRLDSLEGVVVDHYRRIEVQWFDDEKNGFAWLYIATDSTADYVRDYYPELVPATKYNRQLLEWK